MLSAVGAAARAAHAEPPPGLPGQLVTRVVTPRLHVPAKPVPGPPKRFAQAMGAVFTVTAALLYYAFGLTAAADVAVDLLLVAATLESVFAYCLGCKAF